MTVNFAFAETDFGTLINSHSSTLQPSTNKKAPIRANLVCSTEA